jgi:hypothetical protein
MGILDFVKRVYAKMSDKFSYLKIPDTGALIKKIEYVKGPTGKKIISRVHLVVPNHKVIRSGERYRDSDGKIHIHRGKNKMIRDWPNRIEVYDFRNVATCISFLKRIKAKTKAVDLKSPGFVQEPINIVTKKKVRYETNIDNFRSWETVIQYPVDEKMTYKLVNRAIQGVAMAQGLDRVILGKGTRPKLLDKYIGREKVMHKGKVYVRIYDSYLPLSAITPASKAFNDKLNHKMEDDRLLILDVMRRISNDIPVSKLSRFDKIQSNIEFAFAGKGQYLKTKEIALAFVLNKPKKMIAKKAQQKKLALKR